MTYFGQNGRKVGDKSTKNSKNELKSFKWQRSMFLSGFETDLKCLKLAIQATGLETPVLNFRKKISNSNADQKPKLLIKKSSTIFPVDPYKIPTISQIFR